MNTGNTVQGGLLGSPSGGLLGYLNTSIPIPGSTTGTQTTTPAALPQQTGIGEMTGQKPVMPITSSTTPGAMLSAQPSSMSPAHSAILAAHDSTIKALNKPPAQTNIGDSYLSSLGAAKTPAQLAAEQGLTPQSQGDGNMAPQFGAPASTPSVTPGTLGTGSPSSMAATQTPSGLLGNMVGQSQGILQGVQKVTDPFIQQNLDTIQKAVAEEEALTGGSYSGTAADYSGRMAQLENIKQAAQANVNAQQQNLSTFSGQAQNAMGAGLTAATQQVQAPYGTPLYNPLTGTTVDTAGAGASGIVSQWSDYLAKGGDPAQVPSSVSGNSVLWGQVLNGAKAANPSFDVNTALGSAAGRQQVGATGGAIASQQQTQVAQYQSTLQQGQNLQSQLSDLISTFGLNPSNINAVNAGLQKIAQNVSDPHYQQLSNYINEVANTYAQALTPPGGSATDTTRSIATGMLNSTASGQSILSVIQGMDNAVKAKIAGIPTTTGGSTGTPMFGSFN